MEMTQLEKRLVNRESHSRSNIKIMERVFEQLKLTDIQRVLEVGCGIGMASAHLAEKYGMTVTGTDYDPAQVALAKKKFPENENLQFRTADAANLAFGDGEFDLALSLKVLHHIGNWEQALREISRVLRPGGIYFFNDIVFTSEKIARFLRRLVKNYGVYTIKEVEGNLAGKRLEVLHKEMSKEIVIRQQTAIFR